MTVEEAAASLIPADLRKRKQWVLWTVEHRGGKQDGKETKVPRTTTGRRASTTDPKTWSTFEGVLEALAVAEPGTFRGCGFVFTSDDPFAGIDFDDCVDSTSDHPYQLKEWVKPFLSPFVGSYFEISPSGNGVKVWVQAKLKGNGRKVLIDKNTGLPNPDIKSKSDPRYDGGIEVYDQGRYFAVTGMRCASATDAIEDRQEAVDALYSLITAKPKRGDATPSPEAQQSIVEAPTSTFSGSNGSEPQKPDSKVTEGGRHEYLLHRAAQLRRDGMTRDEILLTLRALNWERCDPPKPDDELVKIVNWIESQEATSIDGALAWLKGLKPDSPVSDQTNGFRNFAQCLVGAALVDREAVREQAVRKLKDVGFTAPARMIDAALAPINEAKEDAGSGTPLAAEDIEPWPEPVNGASLLTELTETLNRFVMLHDHADITIALWIVQAAGFDAFTCSPYLAITSPVKRCGKTRLMSVLTALVPNAMPASNIMPAAVFRTIEACRPVLLIDEADTFLRDNEELRGVLNSGHTRDMAFVIRTTGDDFKPAKFSTWCPKAVAMIGRPPQTIEDRSIVIEMARKANGEKVARFRRESKAELEPIRGRIVRWVMDHQIALEKACPEVPMLGSDRAEDNWEPLLAIADLAAGPWPKQARLAARQLTSPTAAGEESGVLLLTDIKELFDSRETDRLSSEEIVAALGAMEERPWSEYRHGRPITKNQTARILKNFGIRPHNIRRSDGTVPKGYLIQDFDDAFRRYTPSQTATSATNLKTGDLETKQTASPALVVAVENPPKSSAVNDVAAVAVQGGLFGGIEANDGKEDQL